LSPRGTLVPQFVREAVKARHTGADLRLSRAVNDAGEVGHELVVADAAGLHVGDGVEAMTPISNRPLEFLHFSGQRRADLSPRGSSDPLWLVVRPSWLRLKRVALEDCVPKPRRVS
jgi:hypothetical protein